MQKILNRKKNTDNAAFRKDTESASQSSGLGEKHENHVVGRDDVPVRLLRFKVVIIALIVSLGGCIFGYDTGQISGFVAMNNFLEHFADENVDGQLSFSNGREGTIVGLLSIGTLIGAIVNGPIADFTGRKKAIVFWNIIFIVGVIVQITTTGTNWVQIAVGRLVAGFGVGGLSVMTPMYQAETAPRQIRGALVSMYQLFITLGIFLSYCINYGTEGIQSEASWRITIGIGFIFPVLMAVGIMFLDESPRWDYRRGKTERARRTIARSYGVPETHQEVVREIGEIKAKFDAENAGGAHHPWYEIFTGPRMMYRTLLGISLQALQQLTGANFFFYYGTSVFKSVGIQNSYITSMILGGINFGCTFIGLYVVEHFGRRKSLMVGGVCMFICFMVFASVGHFSLVPNSDRVTGVALPGRESQAKTAGDVMIVFACLFILSYATTWAPIVWALVSEIFPSRYRSKAMGIATASNWTWNFLISFFTPFITSAIDYRYGYIFAAMNLTGAFVVYFFVCESQGRSLEEIDSMYISHVKPWKSSSWQPPVGEALGETDAAHLTAGGRGIRKNRADSITGGPEKQQIEDNGVLQQGGRGHDSSAGEAV